MNNQNSSILYNFLLTKYHEADIKKIGLGWSSVVFQVDNDIIRFPLKNVSDYEKEQCACNILRSQVSIQIPDTKIFHDKYLYVKHKKIIGSSYKYEQIAQMSPGAKKLLAHDIANFLWIIHKQTIDSEYPLYQMPPTNNVNKYINTQFSPNMAKQVLVAYNNARNMVLLKNTFIHGDLCPNNILLNSDGRLVGVIDWCNCGMGDYMMDFVTLFCQFPSDIAFDTIFNYHQITNNIFDMQKFKQMCTNRILYLLYWAQKESPTKKQYLCIKKHMLEKLKEITV